jgi:hypothetical protein
MVSLWPFRRADTSSAASFEKTLSQLSTKINRYSSQTEAFRSRQRRFRTLWTLYSAFAYILISAILTLVTGVHRWGAVEYTAVAGGPVAIVGVRWLLNAWYDYRVKNVETRLQEATKERAKVIEKLKIATKYDSTQQLLDKYGGGGGGGGANKQAQSQQKDKSPKRKISGRQSLPAQFQQQQGPRTGFAPPPTANIPGRQPSPQNPLDARLRAATTQGGPSPQSPPQHPPQPQQPTNESFAPNAFPSHFSQPAPASAPAPAWYDRILDVVLGEDETSSKNRFALICAAPSCRLVNGQAPPGARSLEDVGRWRCKGCGEMNGVESEVGKVLQQAERKREVSSSEVQRKPEMEERAVKREEDDDDDDDDVDIEESEEQSSGVDTTPAGSTRSKARQRRKA